MSSGELSFDFPPSLRVTWTIPDYFRLATEFGRSLQSPDFAFADGRYCLRLFQHRDYDYEDNYDDDIIIELLNLVDTDPGRAVLCDVHLKSKMDEIDTYRDVSENRVEFFFSRSDLEIETDLLVPDGTLTVLCSVRPRKPRSAATPKSDGAETQVIPKSRNGELFPESPPSLYVTWTIPGFFQLSRDSTHTLESPEFPFCNRRYRLRLSSYGYTRVSIESVNLTGTVPGRCVSYEVGLKSTSGEEIDMAYLHGTSSTGEFRILRSEIDRKKSECFPDGQLTVFCWIRWRHPSSAGLPGIAKLQSDYKQLLLNGVQSDACFVVCGKEFRAHQMILRARSPVFVAMFGHETTERESGRVVMDDLDPDSFGYFLEYLYTGGIDAGLSDDNAFGLYEAADKYDVPTLKAECVAHMRSSLSVDSFCDVLAVALRPPEEELLSRVVLFFKENMSSIMATANWKQFATENGASANELLTKASIPQDNETPFL